MSNLVNATRKELVQGDHTVRKATGGAMAVVGGSALAVPVLAAFIPFFGTVGVAVLLVIIGMAMLLK
jgi:hypothetical protein